MKKNLAVFIGIAMLLSCKKNDNSAAPVQIKVSGLTSKTSVSIKVVNLTKSNSVLLNISNQFGNTTYTTGQAFPGDQLQFSISSNIADDPDGDGDGSFQYYFKGEDMGAHGGIIGSFTETESVPQP